MHQIVQSNDNGRRTLHERCDALNAIEEIGGWFDYYKSIDGLIPCWTWLGGFYIFRESDKTIVDKFELEVVL